MITYKIGNIFEAGTQALVNTVNTMGVMGKGIALQFKNAYPEVYHAYIKAVKNKEIKIGEVQIVPVKSIGGVEYIINFPTKTNWRYPSRIEWIAEGLIDLKQKMKEFDIHSIAMPPLGCGNGGLDWDEVKPLIETTFKKTADNVVVYQPNEKIREILKKEERHQSAKLTPARAMLLYLLYQYRALGEFTSEFAAEKLSYFLQRFGEKQLKLKFNKGFYGPYSGQIRHVLYALNGYYLKGYEQKDSKPFEALEIAVEKAEEVREYINIYLNSDQKQRLEKVASFIQGFESPYGLELLATVDFLIEENNSFETSLIADKLWSERKKIIFPPQHIELAVSHLINSKKELYN
jgi:O-acetyl-ADP-ribose deacetylase (regulator of RNase III)